MGFLDFVFMLVIAGIFGFLATQLMGARKVNIGLMIGLGFIGALVGRFAAHFFHLPALWSINVGNSSFPVIWSILGSLLVVGIFTGFNQQSS